MHSFFSTMMRIRSGTGTRERRMGRGWDPGTWAAKGFGVSPPTLSSAPAAAAGAGRDHGLAEPAGGHHPALGKLVTAEVGCRESGREITPGWRKNGGSSSEGTPPPPIPMMLLPGGGLAPPKMGSQFGPTGCRAMPGATLVTGISPRHGKRGDLGGADPNLGAPPPPPPYLAAALRGRRRCGRRSPC